MKKIRQDLETGFEKLLLEEMINQTDIHPKVKISGISAAFRKILVIPFLTMTIIHLLYHLNY